MSIVTKTGDTGETGLLGGKRVSKADPRIEAIGTLDELCAHLGLIRVSELKACLEHIQSDLFTLGALLAGLKSPKGRARSRFRQHGMAEALKRIEKELYRLEATLPPLKNFILTGGSPAAAELHVARAVCRRAERALVRLNQTGPKDALSYLNRLSDYLFLLARAVNQKDRIKEVIW